MPGATGRTTRVGALMTAGSAPDPPFRVVCRAPDGGTALFRADTRASRAVPYRVHPAPRSAQHGNRIAGISGGAVVPGRHPPIVSYDFYTNVQNLWKSRLYLTVRTKLIYGSSWCLCVEVCLTGVHRPNRPRIRAPRATREEFSWPRATDASGVASAGLPGLAPDLETARDSGQPQWPDRANTATG